MSEKSEITLDTSGATSSTETTETPATETLYAGKYKSVDELVKGYEELQAKASTVSTEAADITETSTDKTIPEGSETTEEGAQEVVKNAGLDWEALNGEYAEKGALAEETYKKLADSGIPKEAVDTYIRGKQAEADAYDKAVFGTAGGEEDYRSLVEWAKTGYTKEEKEVFNEAIVSGNPHLAKMAVEGLAARRAQITGTRPGKSLTGRTSAPAGVQPFKSQHELTTAMNTAEYRKDPAFRELVRQRIAVSEVL